MAEPQSEQLTTQQRIARFARNGPIRWFAHNPVASNLVMIVLLAGGALTTQDLRQEVFPEVPRQMVQVTVAYPGASPEEVEQGIVLAVEEAIRAVDGVEEIRARASEGMASVSADLLRSTDAQQALSDIKSEVDRITTFPQGAERPVISIPSNRMPVVSVIIHGDASLATLEDLAEDSRRALLATPQISVAEVLGVPPPEISIEVPQETLRRYGLTLEEIATAVRNASVDVPSGGIRAATGEILVRTTERREHGPEFREITLRKLSDGSTLTVGDVATVHDSYRQTDEAAYLDGERAVRLQVFRVGDQTPIEVADVVRDHVAKQKGKLPGIGYTLWNDASDVYRSRLNLLLRNAAIGLVLVMGVLGLFLQPRLAFWVTMGIPISFLGAIMFMPALGVSVNMISLFAFLLALGIVVDDTIVVGESVFSERHRIDDPRLAAVVGTRRVGIPVIFAVLTTVVAFAPLNFMPDESGAFYRNIPLIVIPTLLISLFEALFILPSHLAHRGGEGAAQESTEARTPGRLAALQQGFVARFERMVPRYFRPLVEACVRHRYITVAVGAGLLMLSIGLVAGGWVKFNFMPKVEGDEVSVTLEMPFGTPVEDTRAVADKVTQAARDVLAELPGDTARGIYTQVGRVTMSSGRGTRTAAGSHVAEVVISLVPMDERNVGSRELSERWRQKLGEVAGPERIDFQFAVGPGSNESYAVELRHPDQEVLQRAAADLAESLRGISGVFDVDDGFREGKPQLDVTLRPEARALGVTETMLARQLRNAYFGAEAQRDQRGRDELRVYVRLPESQRATQHSLSQFIVRTPTGGEIPLAQAARIRPSVSYTEIERENASRAVDVRADVDADVTTSGDVQAALEKEALPRLRQAYPGMTWEKSGTLLRQDRSFSALSTGLSVALLVMFTLMAMAFRSYVQPILILCAIPFGMVGALIGHMLMGYNLSLLSVLGMVALSGVVVNDSLVLVSGANSLTDEGVDARDAIVQASQDRLRPVLLTSLTTFFGLAPMIFETSVQARFLIPMAVSLGFGVLFVTIIALLLVPALFGILQDAKSLGTTRR